MKMQTTMKRIASQFTFALIIIGLANWPAMPAFFTPTATQAAQAGQPQRPEISVIITQNVLRFVAQGEALEWRLEVINQRGEVVFDSGLTNGASLEWPLLNQQGQAIESGLYAYTLTTKAANDEAARNRRGHLIVDRASGNDRVWVTSSQEAGLGAGSEAAKLTVIGDTETTVGGAELPAAAPPRTSLDDRNALLSPTPPEAVKEEKKELTESRARATAQSLEQPAVYGQGTTNRITKWRHGFYGLIMDSTLSEVNGNVGIGTDTPNQKLVVNGGSSAVRIALNSNAPSLNAGLSLQHNGTPKWSVAAVGTDGDFQIFEDDGGGNRLYIKGDGPARGNVGIGTANPGNGKLHVEGGSQAGVFSSSSVYGVYGYNTSSNSGAGVFGIGSTGVAGSGNTGVRGDSGRSGGVGVYGESPNGYGVYGYGDYGLRGNANSDRGYGVVGYGGGIGVAGIGGASNGYGVYGYSRTGSAVRGESDSGLAGDFAGNVRITGSLSKGGGSFKIDHPLDPENKYLSHSFVESPDMLNIYNDNVTLDDNGEAVVELPEWFGALNRDFRYQLTAIGGPGPNLYIAGEVTNNQFKIAGGQAGLKVSWQVTGIRQDAWANAHRIPVEEMKPEPERGRYLHPAVHGQPEEKGIELARRPVNDGKK